jgi:hypothetical protein
MMQNFCSEWSEDVKMLEKEQTHDSQFLNKNTAWQTARIVCHGVPVRRPSVFIATATVIHLVNTVIVSVFLRLILVKIELRLGRRSFSNVLHPQQQHHLINHAWQNVTVLQSSSSSVCVLGSFVQFAL